MPTVNYSLRIDETDKQMAEQVFKALGMTFSTGINIYLKVVGRQKKIPFDLALDRQSTTSPIHKVLREDKEKSFSALNGILAGHTIDLNTEREERISVK